MVALILSLLFSAHTSAWAYPCPKDFEKDPSKSTLHKWVTQLQGLHSVGSCRHVEITACDPSQSSNHSQILGEIFLVDRHNREVYLPLVIADTSNSKIRTSLESYKRALYYIKWDYFFEKEFGRTETYRLDLKVNRAGNIESIDLGTYSTNKPINRPDGTKSRWYNCKP